MPAAHYKNLFGLSTFLFFSPRSPVSRCGHLSRSSSRCCVSSPLNSFLFCATLGAHTKFVTPRFPPFPPPKVSLLGKHVSIQSPPPLSPTLLSKAAKRALM